MKKVLLLLVIVLLSSGSYSGKAIAQTDVYVSYQEFYDGLSPYGQWINDPQYGNVWVPNIDDDFRPYFTGGHWVMTEYGNTWVSEYPWGWACFHYGRWIYNDYYGWIWVPGYDWGPGWVAWMWTDGFCGWAPLYPGIIWVGDPYSCPEDWWVFMHPRYLYRPRYLNHWRSDYIRGPHHTHDLIQHAHIIKRTYENNGAKYYAGPTADKMQQLTGKPVQVYHLSNAPVRGADQINNNVLSTYHPMKIQPLDHNGATLVPPHIVPAPQPVNKPEELKTKWDQPRPYKQGMQQQNPTWNRPFIRNAPPYEPGEPATRQTDIQNNRNPVRTPPQPQRAPAPAPQRAPAPPPPPARAPGHR